MRQCSKSMVLAVAIVVLATGCSTETMYRSTQAWQRNECQKLQDKAERDRCLANSNSSYDQYRKQTEAPAGN